MSLWMDRTDNSEPRDQADGRRLSPSTDQVDETDGSKPSPFIDQADGSKLGPSATQTDGSEQGAPGSRRLLYFALCLMVVVLAALVAFFALRTSSLETQVESLARLAASEATSTTLAASTSTSMPPVGVAAYEIAVAGTRDAAGVLASKVLRHTDRVEQAHSITDALAELSHAAHVALAVSPDSMTDSQRKLDDAVVVLSAAASYYGGSSSARGEDSYNSAWVDYFTTWSNWESDLKLNHLNQ